MSMTFTKELTKDLMNKYNILNRPKYFSLGIFQNYLVFIPGKTYIRYFSDTTRIDSWKSNGMSKKQIENKLNQTAILHQLLLISSITRHKF